MMKKATHTALSMILLSFSNFALRESYKGFLVIAFSKARCRASDVALSTAARSARSFDCADAFAAFSLASVLILCLISSVAFSTAARSALSRARSRASRIARSTANLSFSRSLSLAATSSTLSLFRLKIVLFGSNFCKNSDVVGEDTEERLSNDLKDSCFLASINGGTASSSMKRVNPDFRDEDKEEEFESQKRLKPQILTFGSEYCELRESPSMRRHHPESNGKSSSSPAPASSSGTSSSSSKHLMVLLRLKDQAQESKKQLESYRKSHGSLGRQWVKLRRRCGGGRRKHRRAVFWVRRGSGTETGQIEGRRKKRPKGLELGSFKVWYPSSSSAREKCKKLELGSARLVYLSSLNEPRLGSSSFMLFELD
ncbi:hypothetical protein LXL04_030486 [Taraxacum kok-saghyz]